MDESSSYEPLRLSWPTRAQISQMFQIQQMIPREEITSAFLSRSSTILKSILKKIPTRWRPASHSLHKKKACPHFHGNGGTPGLLQDALGVSRRFGSDSDQDMAFCIRRRERRPIIATEPPIASIASEEGSGTAVTKPWIVLIPPFVF